MQPDSFLFNYGQQESKIGTTLNWDNITEHYLPGNEEKKPTMDNDSRSFYTYIRCSTTVHHLVIGPFSRWQTWVGCQHYFSPT